MIDATPARPSARESPRPPTAGSDRRPRSCRPACRRRRRAPPSAPRAAARPRARRTAPASMPALAHQLGGAEVDAPSVHAAADALFRSSTGNPTTGGTPRSSRRSRSAGADDRRGERVLAAALDRGGEPQHLVLGPRSGDLDRRDAAGVLRSACPVLSTTSVSTRASSSSASAFLISTPALRAAAGADHDRHRRRQAERARAGDDQHRHGADQRVREARLRARTRPSRRTSIADDDITAGTK